LTGVKQDRTYLWIENWFSENVPRLAVDYLADVANKLDQITRKLSERIHTANLELKRKISARSMEVDTKETASG
jgi:hypothetical protein